MNSKTMSRRQRQRDFRFWLSFRSRHSLLAFQAGTDAVVAPNADGQEGRLALLGERR
jgi:hypothetical protein